MRKLRILGLDPGSQKTGYALAEFAGGEVLHLELGIFKMDRTSAGRAQSLGRLATEVELWLKEKSPEVAAVESLFQHRNVRSALVLAEARGVLLAALGRGGIPVFEYSPATVKKTVCGFGGAEKEQVRRALLQTVPGLRDAGLEMFPLDATDALALAVCHYTYQARFNLLEARP